MKKLFHCFLFLFFMDNINAKEIINANFSQLSLKNVIKITSQAIDKNILISTQLPEKINFVSSKPIYKDEVLDILKTILHSKGFEIVEQNNILNIIKIAPSDNIQIIYLKNTKASDILEILQSLELKSKDKNNIKIAQFKDTNAIILKGLERKIIPFLNLIKELDTSKQQVYVQAKIIEISESKIQDIGIEYGLNGFDNTGSGIMTFASSLNNNQINNALSLEQLSVYGYNPKNIQSGLSLGATINLLKQNKALDIVSEPSILCLNNKESSIYVGETRSIPTGTTIGTTTTTSFKREDIGLKLIVKPRISNNNKITLELHTVLEDIKETDAKTGNPNTNKKEVITTVMVNNGESIILGGLVKNKVETTNSKIPLLGDLPYFGAFFKNSYDIKDKINLVVVVTPYIIPKSKDLTFIMQQLTKLKMLEAKYMKRLMKSLEKQKEHTNIPGTHQKSTTHNQKQHNQRLEELFGL